MKINKYQQQDIKEDYIDVHYHRLNPQITGLFEQAKNNNYEFGFKLKGTGKVIGGGNISLIQNWAHTN